jgi:hypothetical protein
MRIKKNDKKNENGDFLLLLNLHSIYTLENIIYICFL